MTSLHTLLALAAITLVTACASPAGPAAATAGDEHAAHRAPGTASAAATGMQPSMKAMHEMRDRMAKARSPEERQALMADHMAAMHEGMKMMKGMAKAPAAASAAGDGKPMAMHAEMVQRQRSLEERMEMMQSMMEMMLQRLPAAAPSGR